MSLWKLRTALLARRGPRPAAFRVPSVWSGGLEGVSDVNPYDWFVAAVDEILARPLSSHRNQPGWTRDAFVYNFFVRSAASFDHDGDGRLGGAAPDATVNAEGIRETGTFLKGLGMLRHIARLGVDTVYLLPVTKIGQANRKGLLGSPYAIRNPYVLDEHLADPLVPDLSVDEQFAAFTEAAHRLGMRVVLEFVFRTAAQDADWVAEHPDWFYWIKADIPDRSAAHPEGYGNPPFTAEQMKLIRKAGECQGGAVRTPAEVKQALTRGEGELVPPPASYRSMYTDVPETVALDEKSHWRGTLADGTKVRIPGAFADWPPDDVQPPWTDVTYLRMYGRPDEADFNYMAYNTLRLYDPNLADEGRINRDLWSTVAEVVPSYQERFGIDGVMIDMGHALPLDLARDIQKRARQHDPGFAFWEEKFFLDPESPKTGYEAVVGPGPFTLPNPAYTASWLRDFAGAPVGFFATGENHNTPRLAAGPEGEPWVRAAWALALFLPGAIPFVHNGVEVLDKLPINTGLGFSPEDLARLKDTPLGLFDASAFSWEKGGADMIPFMCTTAAIRRRHLDLVRSRDAKSYRVPASLPPAVIGYERLSRDRPRLAVLVNVSRDEPASVAIPGPAVELLSGENVDGSITIVPRGVAILEFGGDAA